MMSPDEEYDYYARSENQVPQGPPQLPLLRPPLSPHRRLPRDVSRRSLPRLGREAPASWPVSYRLISCCDCGITEVRACLGDAEDSGRQGRPYDDRLEHCWLRRGSYVMLARWVETLNRSSRKRREIAHAPPSLAAGTSPAAIHRRTVSSDTPRVLAI
jgi:hypothetical protein